MPLYEFHCSSCDARFEELVGSHVGLAEEDVVCPTCGGSDIERLTSLAYAPIHRRLTSGQQRRLEASRSRDYTRRKEEFKRKRAAARKARPE